MLGVVAALAVQALAPVAEAKVRRKRLAEGVVLTTIKQRKPRLHVRVVRIRPEARVNIRTGLAQGRLPGLERTSSMARKRRALVAVNGDYAERSGRPVMTFARKGKLIQTPLSWGRNFAIERDRRTSYIGPPRLRVELSHGGAEDPIPIARVNAGKPRPRQLAAYTRAGGRLIRPPRHNSCQARLLPTSGPRIASLGLELGYKVGHRRCGAGRLAPRGGVVIAARRGTAMVPYVKALVPGESATLRWSLGWERVHETVGGNPTLIEDGRVVVGHSSHPFFQRHPRTGVGLTRNGTVLLITVDGRRRKSIGVTLRGFARMFSDRGAAWALNLDGGGSTTMVVRGKVVNSPSDRRERPVSSALLVTSKSSTSAGRVAGSSSEASAHRVWREVVSDPASTGGLASSLVERGESVPSTLRQAAVGFDWRHRSLPGR